MKLLVIGHSVFDVIEDETGLKESPGGIFYTVSALNKINLPEDEIFLCSCYDDNTHHFFLTEFSKVNTSLLNRVEKIPRVNLILSSGKERIEKYENINKSLEISVPDYNIFNGIMINMITGFDITINQLQEIRANFNGIIFMDVHTLSRGLDKDQSRKFRVIPGFENWAKCLDVVQVNQSEVYTLFPLNSELEIAKKLLTMGVRVLCVTKGELGAKIYYNNDNEIFSFYIAAKNILKPVLVGCGDVFGSTFFYNYIRNQDARFSLSLSVINAEQFVAGKF